MEEQLDADLFIGTVLVRNLPPWRMLHNGYPVVHLAENTALDISALARSGLQTGAPDLRADLPCAERLTPRP